MSDSRGRKTVAEVLASLLSVGFNNVNRTTVQGSPVGVEDP